MKLMLRLLLALKSNDYLNSVIVGNATPQGPPSPPHFAPSMLYRVRVHQQTQRPLLGSPTYHRPCWWFTKRKKGGTKTQPRTQIATETESCQMTTRVTLPQSLIYPVEITQILAKSGDNINKHQDLLRFKYWKEEQDGVPEEGEEPKMITREFYATFESPLAGNLEWLGVNAGDRINDHTTQVLGIREACDHAVQYSGLCAICGAVLDTTDYLDYNDAERAPIAMSHDTNGLTVSRDEAERIEKSSTDQLLADRKLILVVDLDQTIIHAAMDPAIGQWIEDKDSPNHKAVSDVRKFCLREPRRDQFVDSWYYVKIRPGLEEFLEKMYSRFEMHIYTMATKAYALEIAKLVDPTGKYFGDRILSREESGNLLQKNLKRLFPVTTHLVTIIDDRGDVWQWSPHLVRVFPYSFFHGTGDINSQFLPKRTGLVTPETEAEADDPEHRVLTIDTDDELDGLGGHLISVHEKFYAEYDRKQPAIPDVGNLLPHLKSRVFDGCVILFTGVFPIGTSLDSADIVQWVRSFGAVVVAELVPAVTHVITHSGGTLKARQAAGMDIPVLSTSWLFACLREWVRVDIAEYRIEVTDKIMPTEHPELPGGTEPEKDIAEGFVRSLSRGDLNWDEINSELKEFMGSDDDSDVFTDDNEFDQQPARANGEDSAGLNGKRTREEDDDSNSKRKKSGDEAHVDEDDFAAELERDLM